jgi:hypothetical protein
MKDAVSEEYHSEGGECPPYLPPHFSDMLLFPVRAIVKLRFSPWRIYEKRLAAHTDRQQRSTRITAPEKSRTLPLLSPKPLMKLTIKKSINAALFVKM